MTDSTAPLTASEAVVAIVGPSYADLPDTDEGHDEALRVRTDSLIAVIQIAQAAALADHGVDDPAGTFTEPELNTLLGDRAAFPEVDAWSHEVPLMLLATHFHPYSDADAPSGNVMLLDPVTETTYADAMVALGLLPRAES